MGGVYGGYGDAPASDHVPAEAVGMKSVQHEGLNVISVHQAKTQVYWWLEVVVQIPLQTQQDEMSDPPSQTLSTRPFPFEKGLKRALRLIWDR